MIRQLAAALALVLAGAAPASAAVIGFDDLSGPVPAFYNGLNWSLFYPSAGGGTEGTGYDNGRVSGDTVVFTPHGIRGEITAKSFTFEGGWFTAALREDLQLVITGFDTRGEVAYAQQLTIGVNQPYRFTANWTGLSRLRFDSHGGVRLPFVGSFGPGRQYVIDDLAVSDVVSGVAPGVPEPATWAAMILGFGMIGAALRRRRGLADVNC